MALFIGSRISKDFGDKDRNKEEFQESSKKRP
jgi:hypothetical protein